MGPSARLAAIAAAAVVVSAVLYMGAAPASSAGSMLVPVMSGHGETVACAVLYAARGSTGSIMARNGAGVPVEIRVEIGGENAGLRLGPGEEGVVARLRFEGTGVYTLRVSARPLAEPAGIEPVDVRVAVEGPRGLAALHYAASAMVVAVLGALSTGRILSSRGLYSRLEPAAILGIVGGLVFPASRAGVEYGFTMITCGAVEVGCPADSVIAGALQPAASAGEPLVLLAVIVGSLAVMYEPGYAAEYYDAMLASLSPRRILLYAAAAYLSLLAGILAALAGIAFSTGRFQVALAAGVTRETLLVAASWILEIALLVGTALAASAGLGAGLRRSRWVGVTILLLLLAVPGELFSINYSGCPDRELQAWAGPRGKLLLALAAVAPVVFVARWRRR